MVCYINRFLNIVFKLGCLAVSSSQSFLYIELRVDAFASENKVFHSLVKFIRTSCFRRKATIFVHLKMQHVFFYIYFRNKVLKSNSKLSFYASVVLISSNDFSWFRCNDHKQISFL